MKAKILAALMAAFTAMSVSACAHKSDNNMMEKKKVLVVYFSATGTTASAAQILAKATDGALCEIVPQETYTTADLDWHDQQSRSSVEMRDKSSRPEIKKTAPDMKDYDVVYVGFPIWWYIAPTIVNTFLESCDFSGKILIPFATSGGSDVGETDKYLRVSCSKETQWKPAKRFSNSVQPESLRKWVEGLHI